MPNDRLDMTDAGSISIIKTCNGNTVIHATFDRAGVGRRTRSRCWVGATADLIGVERLDRLLCDQDEVRPLTEKKLLQWPDSGVV